MDDEDTEGRQYDHELLHTLQVFETMVERLLFEHPALERYPAVKNHVGAAMDALAEAYQEMGRASMGVEPSDSLDAGE